MAATTTQAGSTRSRPALAVAFACLAAALVAIGIAFPADAVNSKEIGKTRRAPDPSCPTPNDPNAPSRKDCQVFGEVTGFQKTADGKKAVMRIPRDGRIVGWAVDLSRPSKDERMTFEDVLSGDPSARLAMLTKADGTKYRLRAKSPTVKLNGLYEQRQYFTLRNPIAVKKGWITALTSASWVPNFAHDLNAKANDNVWKASRTRKRCEGYDNLTKRSEPHKKVGSTRGYGCTYKDARILYWAYFVPS